MSVEHEPPSQPRAAQQPRLRILPMIIFSSRWLQLPLYLGLIVAQCVYIALFVKELWHVSFHALDWTEQQIMMSVLALIDVVMISNLLVMVIVGGYETIVSRLDLQGHPDEPEWLDHVNASVLKIKLAMAIIGISSIALLRTFIEAGNLGSDRAGFTETGVMWQVLPHLHRIGDRHRLCRQAVRDDRARARLSREPQGLSPTRCRRSAAPPGADTPAASARPLRA